MSGGVAYVWDTEGDFAQRCNSESFELEGVTDAVDIAELRQLISNHQRYTGSTVARHILDNWSPALRQFVKVMPTEYKRVLLELATRADTSAMAV